MTNTKNATINSTKEEMNMNKQEFAQAIATKVNGEVKEMEKANGVILTGILTGAGSVRPTIYIDDMYADGMSVDEAAEKITEIANRETPNIDVDNLADWESMRPLLRARLYNKATRAEISRPAPAPFNDLIIIPYVVLSESLSFKVTMDILNRWNVSAKEVMDIAESNAKADAKLQGMTEILREMGMYVPQADDEMMWVVSNSSKICGAYGVIALMDELKARFKDGFTVLPSSIHEVIITPLADESMLTGMVQEVNATEVNVVDQLSNHAYIIAA